MKNVILFFVSVVSFWTCSEKKVTIVDQNGEITSSNIVEKINEQVKHYPKEPVYHVYVKNSLCVYELLVNDYPVAKMFNYGQMMTPFTINNAILKSGKQKITLRLYPAPAEYSRSGDVLSPNTSCKLEIEYIDNQNPNKQSSSVAEFKLPTKIRMAGEHNDMAIPEFEGAGKKYYEITYEFYATVPYVIDGWKKGQDLTKLDQKKLEKEVVKVNLNRKKEVEEKLINKIAASAYLPFKEQMVSEYETKEYITKSWKEYIEVYSNSTYKIQPLKDYKIVFFGNNKMVCLRQISNDIRLKEQSGLWGTYKLNGTTYSDFHYLYLYLPEGKKLEDGLEVIR